MTWFLPAPLSPALGTAHRGQDAGELAGGGGQCRAAGAGGGDQVGESAPPPCGDAVAGEHARAEGERFGACVQGGVTQLLVTGI